MNIRRDENGKVTRIILSAVSTSFWAQTMLCAVENYPVRDIKHIMPWDAGGGTDIVMRAFMIQG